MPERKDIKFKNERADIFSRLIDILKINNGKNTFILHIIDENPEVQQNILSLKEDIKKYHSSSSCRGLNKKNSKRPYMSIIRFILKENGYKLNSSDFSIKSNDEDTPPIRTKRYSITPI